MSKADRAKMNAQFDSIGFCYPDPPTEATDEINMDVELNLYVAKLLKNPVADPNTQFFPDKTITYTGHHVIKEDVEIAYDWQNKPLYRSRTILAQFKSKDGSKQGCVIRDFILVEHHLTGNQYEKGVLEKDFTVSRDESGTDQDEHFSPGFTPNEPGDNRWLPGTCFEKQTRNWLDNGTTIDSPVVKMNEATSNTNTSESSTSTATTTSTSTSSTAASPSFIDANNLPPMDKNGKGYYERKTSQGIVTEQGYQKAGKDEGEKRLYTDDGKLEYIYHFQNGVQNGSYAWYNTENGKLWQEGSFLNGKKDGAWKIYDADGNLKEEGNYKNNVRDGEWKRYKDGKFAGTDVYVNGEKQ